MSDNPLGFLVGLDTSPADDDAATAPSAHYVDPRDVPQPSPGATEGEGFDPPSTANRGPDPVIPVRVMEPVPTIPGFGRILVSNTFTIPATSGPGDAPFLAGIEPSRVQGQLHVAYMKLLVVGGTVQVANDRAAMPSGRFTLPTAMLPQHFDHIGGCYLWGDDTNAITVSVLVVGV